MHIRVRPARALYLAAFGLAAVSAPLHGQGRINVPYEQFKLSNGLTVILHRDATTPTIATNVWYHVGSSREIPGRTGFAHLFEHVMFEGSKNVPEGKIDEWFEEVGGSPNGSTTRDRTNYMQSFSSNALDMALFIESDRMAYLIDAMSPASVDGQRDVVKNERRQSYDNRPYGLAGQLITEELYPSTHPYSWPVIGYMDHLTAASYDDVTNFYKKYYAPNNASIAITGDLDVKQARQLAEKWFGELPRGDAVSALAAPVPSITETKRIMLEDRVQLPRLYMTWISPAGYGEGDIEMRALGRVLAGGKNSRLYKRLVYELQIADDVSAGQNGGKLNGDFQITATARAGHTLAELEKVILEEIEKLKTTPPDPREVQRIVNQTEVTFLEGLERASAKADALNMYLFYTGRPDYFNEELDQWRQLTPQAISSVTSRYLDASRRIVLSIVPAGKTDLAIPGSRLIPNQNLQLSPEARKKSAT